MKAHASCVRGNHEDRILLSHRDQDPSRVSVSTQDYDSDPGFDAHPGPGLPRWAKESNDPQDDEVFEFGYQDNKDLTRSLGRSQVDYLNSCPLILELGEMDGMGKVRVVHAGLNPGVDLEKQDPMGVMNMRTIDLKTHVPSKNATGVAWSKVSKPSNLPSSISSLSSPL